jgi:hypothetical protein
MKKLVILLSFILISLVCHSQNNYYWSGGRKIWLETDSAQVIVQFNAEKSMQTFIAKTSSANKLSDKGVALVALQSKSDTQKIETDQSIINKTYVNRFTQSNIPFYLTGDIIMQPKKGISCQTVLSKFKIDGQITKETSTGITVVRLNNWDKTFDIANTIYESGLVDWCHPDFITRTERTTNDPLF